MSKHHSPTKISSSTNTKINQKLTIRLLLHSSTFWGIIVIIAVFLALATIVFLQQLYTDRKIEQARQQVVEILQDMSNRDSGDTYDEFVRNIITNPPREEVIAVFDQNGNKLIEVTSSSELYVNLPQKALKLLVAFNYLTHVHTHPHYDISQYSNPDAYEPSCFSDLDLSMLYRTGLENHVDTLAVVSGNRVYRLERNGHDWLTPEEVGTFYQSLVPESLPPEQQWQTLIDNGFLAELTVQGRKEFENQPKFTQYAADRYDYNFYIDIPDLS